MLQHRCSLPLVRWQGSPIGCCVGPCALVGVVVSIAVWDFFGIAFAAVFDFGHGRDRTIDRLVICRYGGRLGFVQIVPKIWGRYYQWRFGRGVHLT